MLISIIIVPFSSGFTISDTKVNGAISNRLPGHSSITFTGVRSRQLINILSDFQIYASTGSACSCLTNTHSYVLRAIGLTDSEIEGTVRFSFGKENTISDIDQVVNVLKNAVSKCRKTGQN
ncbi:aminotransferase class V-fold PLP-dependent enzyme [Butyricicoccus sp. 1XD8-22]|nr:aminotransferase class V-fold PLP-dependent enzyme [Butyricicoccus sp. 1XD8-22]